MSILCRSAQYRSRLGWSYDTAMVTSPPDTDQDTLYASAPPLATSQPTAAVACNAPADTFDSPRARFARTWRASSAPRIALRPHASGTTRRRSLQDANGNAGEITDKRAEHAHQLTRERERRIRRFKSPGHAQRFLAAYGPSVGHFRPRRHRLTAAAYRATRTARFATWRAVTGTPALAQAAAPPSFSTPAFPGSPAGTT